MSGTWRDSCRFRFSPRSASSDGTTPLGATPVQIALARRFPAQPFWIGGGLAALALGAGFVASSSNALLVPVFVGGLLGGGLLLLRPHLGVLCLLAALMFRYPEWLLGLGWLSPNTLIALALAGILGLTVLVTGRAEFLKSNQIRIFILIGVLLGLNWYFSGSVEPPANLANLDLTQRVIDRYVFQFMFIVFAVAFIRSPGQLLALTALFLFAVFWTIPGAIFHSYSGEPMVTKAEALRAAATTGAAAAENSNRLAFIALMGASLVWFAVQPYRSSIVRLLGLAAMLALVITVFMSGSRSGVLNLALLSLLLLWQSRLRAGQIAVLVVMAAVAVGIGAMLVPQPVWDRLMTFIPSEGGDAWTPDTIVGSNVRRLTILEAGLKLVAENPILGVGIGNFRWMAALDPSFGGIVMSPHNAYLGTLAEGGIVLLGGYLLLFGWTLRDLTGVIKQSARSPEVGLRWLAVATRTNLILFLAFSLFAEVWKEFFFLLIIATSAVLAQIYRRAAERA
jgi:O-antigen ligase